MKYYLGIDVGNTKTIALVADQTGTVLGAGRGGPGDIYLQQSGVPMVENWKEAVAQALSAAGLPLTSIACATLSAAGADWAEDYADILALATLMLAPVKRITVYNDALGSIAAGCPEGWGVGLVAGTGLAAGSRRVGGEFWHASFWVEQGGADALTRLAWAAVKKAALGIGHQTCLTGKILSFFEAASVEDLLHRQTGRHGTQKPILSRFAPAIIDAAEEGDVIARQLVVEAGADLGEWAVVAAKKAGFVEGSYPVALSGGLFRHVSTLLETSCQETIQRLFPCASLVRADIEPAGGAIFLAIESDGGRPTPEVKANFRHSCPPASLFNTFPREGLP